MAEETSIQAARRKARERREAEEAEQKARDEAAAKEATEKTPAKKGFFEGFFNRDETVDGAVEEAETGRMRNNQSTDSAN